MIPSEYQESLDDFALCELIGHYVNYRKQWSESFDNLLPKDLFRLYAVAVRYPNNLAKEVTLIPMKSGVYEVEGFSLRVRIIVIHQLPEEQQNAMFHLFSAREGLVEYGQQHYRPRSKEISTLLYELLNLYQEDQDMSEKLKEFVRQTLEKMVNSLPPDERLKSVPAEERLKNLPPEEALKALKALSPEVQELLAQRLKNAGGSPSP